MALAVASRYARALADLVFDARRTIDPEGVGTELAAFDYDLAESADLRSVLLSPAVSPVRKRAVVARLVERAGISRLVRNFICVLIDHRRIALLPEIRQAFHELVNERLGLVEVRIEVARELSQEQRAKVEQRLTRISDKKVRPKFATDEQLIGGMVARIGSKI
jgi:F-type H+-transporting ATPase subunit delta